MSDMFPFTAEDLAVFFAETEELITLLEDNLLAIESAAHKDPPVAPAPEVVAAAFRAAHTLKGSSGAVGLSSMSGLTHAMESVLDRIRGGEIPRPQQVDAMLRGVDHLRSLAGAAAQVVAAEGPSALETFGKQEDEQGRQLQDLLTRASAELPAEQTAVATAVAASPTAGGRLLSAEGGLWQVVVEIHPECTMPAVRAYQVVLALENLGEIASSNPSLEEIEAERAGHHLEMQLETSAPPEEVKRALLQVSDITTVSVKPMSLSADTAGLPPGTAVAASGPATVAGGPGTAVSGAGGPAAVGGPGSAGGPGGGRSVRVDVRVLDELMNLAGELVIQRTRLGQLLTQLSPQTGRGDDDLGKAVEDVGRVASRLQEQVMKARMLPVENLFRRFPRMVRDLAAKARKEVELTVRGEETELDRAVIEEIGDPLVHILRNSVDHGLETPEERERVGKARTGQIELSAQHEENYVLISVRDDGRGIDVEKVRRKAVERRLVRAEQAATLSEEEVIDFIFAPGFSTADRVSEISGRGVGLDVVRRNIQRLGGSLQVDNFPGQGVQFSLRLPLTLAIIRCLLCLWGDEVFALPLGQVEEVVEVDPSKLTQVYQRRVLMVRDTPLAFLPLDAALGLGSQKPAFAVIVHGGSQTAALGVTGLIGDQEVVVKDLGTWLGSVRGIAGATILGDGRVALILDIPTVLRGRKTRTSAA